MKILICTFEAPPKGSGIANVVRSVVDVFKEKGHECTICSPTGPDIQLGNQAYIEKFGGLGLLYFWENARKYIKKNSFKYDYIWLQQPLFIFPYSIEKSIITIHTTYYGYSILNKNFKLNLFLKLYYNIMAIIESFSFIRLSKNEILFTYIDNQLYRELSKIGLKMSNSRLISNGVDIDKFKPSFDKKFLKNKYSFSNDNIIFLSIGRHTEQKNLFELIDVFLKINNEMKFSSLIFVGKGEQSHELQKYVKSLNLQNNIHFFGYISPAELLDIYSMSDYYIMSSKYEGQPLTLLEAMASGLPCIVSDIPCLRIVEDANCGIVIDFSDHEKAAHKIIDYIRKDNSEHGKNARKYTEEYLDWSIIAEKYLIEFKNKGKK